MAVRPSVRDPDAMSKRREAAFVEPAHDGEVEVGERVTVLELTTGAVNDYRIGEGGVSPDSLLGSALLGRHVGDVVDVALAGISVRLEVVEIDG
jgi:transcription elongation GreA/GreB family factor